MSTMSVASLFKRTQPPAAPEPTWDPTGVTPVVSLTGIEKSFPVGSGQSFVLRRIGLEIKAGEFVSIMGPSGAGKSTMLHILGMHDTAWSGEFYFDDQPVHKIGKKERADLRNKNVGFVFQSYHLLDNLTVYENLEIPLSYRDIKKSERQSIVCDVLDRFNIVGKRELYPTQLSGGQQQLVGVARAVIANPKIILADEPTGNLHSDQGREIMELFKRLNSAGTTIVQVTHSDTNASYGDRIIRLRDGWIVTD
jgi:ABC-type lipoprotein export system ATPase subunit